MQMRTHSPSSAVAASLLALALCVCAVAAAAAPAPSAPDVRAALVPQARGEAIRERARATAEGRLFFMGLLFVTAFLTVGLPAARPAAAMLALETFRLTFAMRRSCPHRSMVRNIASLSQKACTEMRGIGRTASRSAGRTASSAASCARSLSNV